jgi:hypothetical protein
MDDMSIEEHKKKYFKALRPVTDDLREIGVEINRGDFTHLQAKDGVVLSMQDIGIEQEDDDLQYLSRKYKPLPQEAIEVLLKWVPEMDYPPAQEVLISQLSGTKIRYNGNILLNAFKTVNSSLVRERIGLVLIESNPNLDLNELERILLDRKYGQQKSTLLLAGIKFLPKDKINHILKQEFHQHFLIAIRGLSKSGGKAELEFLEKQLKSGNPGKEQSKKIEKAIEQIKARMAA